MYTSTKNAVLFCLVQKASRDIFKQILYFSLPLIGHMYVLGRKPVEVLHAHQKKYGDIFRLDSGPLPTVFLCNYEQIVNAMKQDIFAARPHHLIPGYTQVW